MRTRTGRRGAESNSAVCALFCVVAFSGIMGIVWGTSKQPPPEDWPNFAFGSSGDLLSVFFLALNPKNFYNPSDIQAKILNSCEGIFSASNSSYNSFSFCQLSEQPGGYYRKQAEIYTNFGNRINGSALDCVVNLIEPMCSTKFFTDWKIGYKVLFPISIAAGFCCLTAMACCVISACINNRKQSVSASQKDFLNGSGYVGINSDESTLALNTMPPRVDRDPSESTSLLV